MTITTSALHNQTKLLTNYNTAITLILITTRESLRFFDTLSHHGALPILKALRVPYRFNLSVELIAFSSANNPANVYSNNPAMLQHLVNLA